MKRYLYFLPILFILGACTNDATKKTDPAARSKTIANLTPLAYDVTQCDATEPPFQNAFWNHKAAGLYVDVVSGEALFASVDKFDSGTGWPSFTRPVSADALVKRTDRKLGYERIEVRSRKGNSHLGHVFDDGPGPGGLRYCINSAALRFIPVDRLEAERYGKYLPLFGRVRTAKTTEVAILASGCFWGAQALLRALPGVVETRVGYIGGDKPNPRYEDTHAPGNRHAEAVRIVFDPQQTSYETILNFFFRMHDPTTRNRQGNDVGASYRSAIFWTTEAQRAVAERVRTRINARGRWAGRVATEITKATTFWDAEEYHQDYLRKHPGGYTCHYVRPEE